MINTDAIKRISVFLFIIFTLLINLLYLSLSVSYEKGNYSEYNSSIKTEFYKNNPLDKINSQELCSSLEPNLFLRNYNKIVFLSFLAILLSTAVIFVSLKRKILLKKQGYFLLIVVFLSFLVFFKAFLIEADYDFVGCEQFL